MSLGRAMHGVPLSRCCWASKQMSGHFAHGKNMVWWKQCSSAECPRCGVMQEDKAHIIKCPQDSFTTQWEATITNLTKWMKDENSALHLIQALVEGLQAWQSETISLDDLQVSTKQPGIGWDGILDGWLSMEWQAQQEAYWAQWRQRKSSKNNGQWNLSRNCGIFLGTCGTTGMRPFTTCRQLAMIFLTAGSMTKSTPYLVMACRQSLTMPLPYSRGPLTHYYNVQKPIKNVGWHQCKQQYDGNNSTSMRHTFQNNAPCNNGLV